MCFTLLLVSRFAEWQASVITQDLSVYYPLFYVVHDVSGTPFVEVHFDEACVNVSKEVRHLKWLGFGPQIDKRIINLMIDVRLAYVANVTICLFFCFCLPSRLGQ